MQSTCHFVKRCRQTSDFVAAVDACALLQVTCRYRNGSLNQPVQGMDDALRNQKPDGNDRHGGDRKDQTQHSTAGRRRAHNEVAGQGHAKQPEGLIPQPPVTISQLVLLTQNIYLPERNLIFHLGYHKHVHYPFEKWFGFYAFYGYFLSVGLVLAARELRKLLSRDEDYYD